MKNKFAIVIAALLIIAIAGSLIACRNPNLRMVDEVTLNADEAIAITGEQFALTATINPADATNREVTWSSSDTNVVSVDNQGNCTTNGVGHATVTATAEGGRTANCEVFVGDKIVDGSLSAASAAAIIENGEENGEGDAQITENGEENGEETGDQNGEENGEETGDQNGETQLEIGGELGTTLFATISEALQNAEEGDTIIIMEGIYDEDVSINKSVTLLGIRQPSLKSFNSTATNNAEFVLRGLVFTNTEFPGGGQATVTVPQGAALEMTDCVFVIDTNEQPLAGGFAVFVDKQSQGVDINNCTFANYRYGIFISPTDQEVRIVENTFTNLTTGIGIDIRQENSEPAANYPTTGEVARNEYNEVETRTQFFHYGENYDGDFDFADNETQNAAEGDNESGGQGLLD